MLFFTKSDTMFCIATKQQKWAVFRNLKFLICGIIVWNTKQMSLLHSLLWMKVIFLITVSVAMMFSKLPVQ
ncbi:membrane protein [gut metagenome]|uniref:Membrane protein n=1 Tax=gut metagenome TaxID=749906 RepID=J9G384_9ZZZZ